MWNALDAVGPWLVGLAFIGGPVALAWWLSSRFKNIEWGQGHGEPGIEFRPWPNHRERRSEVIPVDKTTGAPLYWP